jgi:homoserine O-acetyltransferase
MPVRRPVSASPQPFILVLPDLALERGGTVRRHRAAVWWWSRHGDLPVNPLGDVPTVVLVHALTGGAKAGGPGGWWEPLIGPGRAIDPNHYRVICFNNLGSFYGSSAPGMPGFPKGKKIGITSTDIARAILLGLDALGIQRIHLAAGGSLGGMAALALGALAPGRVERILPIATTATSTAWVIGWNHVARGILKLDQGYPHHVGRGLEVARQLAMMTYRAEPGLEAKRRVDGRSIQTYLEHHGRKLHVRFPANCYESQLDAMDHHDLLRPLPGTKSPAIERIKASTLVLDVDTDQLFPPAQSDELVRLLRANGGHVERATLRSPHGHDAFLLEWDQLAPLVTRALLLPAHRNERKVAGL